MSDLIDRQALLKQIDIDSDGEPGYYGDTWKFIDTIKNMPNVHDLPKDTDTISRQAVLALPIYNEKNLYGNIIREYVDIEDVKQLPPAQPEQPEPKRGEWLERDVIDEPKGKHITQWQSARCSVCGRYHTTPYLYSFTHYNFCPNCGAEMEVAT